MAFHGDFQRKAGQKESKLTPRSTASEFTSYLSATTRSSTAATDSSFNIGELEEADEDDSWELEFMSRLEEISRKESQNQGPARHLGRQQIIAAQRAQIFHRILWF
mmetsp:Transcript_60545/g.95849  ORF Transcript_60545/g.95849 Transcript_60545/m.95849 type:complete len:106 (+) Transcript_60545:204-521(+)